MAIDERSRHELFLKLEHVLGAGEATTLMEYFPPVGWADVATKRDLDHLKSDLKNELIAYFRGELNTQTRTMLFTMCSLMVTIATLAFAAARLI